MFKHLLLGMVVAGAVLTTAPNTEVNATENVESQSVEVQPFYQHLVVTNRRTTLRSGTGVAVRTIPSGIVLDTSATRIRNLSGHRYTEIRNVASNGQNRLLWVRISDISDWW